MTTWWSNGKKQELVVEDMNVFHARQALAKLGRGEYFNASGDAPTPDETEALRNALRRTIRAHEDLMNDGDVPQQ